MSTIITVHGTGATGPEAGERWWQKGSEFEKHIRELVESEDGELTWLPHIWDGANSENSRRFEAKKLHNKILKFEENQEDYCLIGHSHGGSVITAALLECAISRTPLEKLASWITIGTPFIEFKKRALKYLRINQMGKLLYLTVATLLFAVLLPSTFLLVMDYNSGAINSSFQILTFILLLYLPVGVIYLTLPFFEPNELKYLDKKNQEFFGSSYNDSWVSLWHKNDEAIHLLKSLSHAKLEIFKPNFLTQQIIFIFVFLPPLLILIFAINDIDTRGTGAMRDIYSAIHTIGQSILNFLAVGTFNLSPADNSSAIYSKTSLFIGLICFLILVFIYISMFYLMMFYVAADDTSSRISGVLNRASKRQIHQSGLGNDTFAEYAVGADTHPIWLPRSFKPLPDVLGNEITEVSNVASAKSLAKFRDELHLLTYTESGDEKSKVVADYLSWNELIHTTYFEIPRFRKLVAYAITQADGFMATEKFKSDPDYQTVAIWYEELKPEPAE